MSNGISTKTLLVTLAVFFVVIISLLILTNKSVTNPQQTQAATQATNKQGVNYLDMTVKGGYRPDNLTAKANTPYVLRLTTTNTFDCSAALLIPGLKYRNHLPPTGITEIDIPAQQPGSIIKGSCSMGMYGFQIAFN